MSCPGINFQYPIFCYIAVPLYIPVMSFAEQHHQYRSKSYFFCFVVISNLDLKLEVMLQASHLLTVLFKNVTCLFLDMCLGGKNLLIFKAYLKNYFLCKKQQQQQKT